MLSNSARFGAEHPTADGSGRLNLLLKAYIGVPRTCGSKLSTGGPGVDDRETQRGGKQEHLLTADQPCLEFAQWD